MYQVSFIRKLLGRKYLASREISLENYQVESLSKKLENLFMKFSRKSLKELKILS